VTTNKLQSAGRQLVPKLFIKSFGRLLILSGKANKVTVPATRALTMQRAHQLRHKTPDLFDEPFFWSYSASKESMFLLPR
jgi:hypothetical protein